ncbi:hypothetical protein [Streptomyces sp. NPDC020965]|uniref:hypothetical protein n=1 Tax=Streptomyces sp. NPDC020965 TaxID=3365105 RepID=UPI0037B38838
MPRGRHRHSPPLHRLLPPSAVAGAAVLCAAGAWLLTEPVMLRALVAAAAAAAVTGAVIMRSWDRAAGRQVADLTRGRASDAWQTEERIAELEADAEGSRELRAKLDAKLRAKRVELAALRGEHAALLRRYATAETERATALEGRRQLAIEASGPATSTEATASTAATDSTEATGAVGTAPDKPTGPKALPPARSATPTAATFLRAARALDNLSRTAAGAAGAAAAGDTAAPTARTGEADEPQGKPSAGAGGEQHTRPTTAAPALAPARHSALAAAIVPYGPRRAPVRHRPDNGFDFFGTQTAAGHPAKAIEAVQEEDLADVVGEEALAESRSGEARAAGDVIDLTAHDETEQLDLGQLRNAVGS